VSIVQVRGYFRITPLYRTLHLKRSAFRLLALEEQGLNLGQETEYPDTFMIFFFTFRHMLGSYRESTMKRSGLIVFSGSKE
jgi:hypothetical protein